jgi:hypothetical protein
MKLFLYSLLVVLVTCQIIDHSVQQNFEKNEKSNIIIFFKQQLDFSKSPTFKSFDEKSNFIFQELNKISKESQKETIQFLNLNSLNFKSLFSPNCILVNNFPKNLLKSFEIQKNIERIYLNQNVRIPLEEDSKIVKSNEKIEWNIKWIEADKLWEKGFKGKNVIVSNAGNLNLYRLIKILEFVGIILH